MKLRNLSSHYRKILFTTTALVAIGSAMPASADNIAPVNGGNDNGTAPLSTSLSTGGYNFITNGGDNLYDVTDSAAILMDDATNANQIVTLTGSSVTTSSGNTIDISADAAQITIDSGLTLGNTSAGDTINYGAITNTTASTITVNGILSNSGGGQAIDAALTTGGTLNINLNAGGSIIGDINFGQGTNTFTAATGSTFVGAITGSGIAGTDNITLGNVGLSAAIDGGADADTLTLTAGAHTNAISNVESLILAGGTLTTSNTITGLTSALTVGTGTTLTANNNITGAGSVFTFDGTTNVGAANVLTLGTLAGNAAGVNSVYGVNITPTVGSNITITSGTAYSLAGTDVSVRRDTSQFLTNGTNHTIFTNLGAGALTIPADAVIDADNSYVLSYSVAAGGTGGNDLILTTTRNAYNNIAQDKQTSSIGAALESYGANSFGTNTQLDTIVLELDSMTTANQVDEALESLSPAINGIGEASMATLNTVLNNVESRLDAFRSENREARRGINSGDDTGYTKGAWLQGFGNRGDQDVRDGIDGYEFDTVGGSIGFDSEKFWNGALTGISFTYANTDVDSDAANNAQTDINSYQVAAYMTKTLSPRYNGIYLDGIASFAYNDYENTRSLAVGGFTGNTTGDFDGYQAAVRLAVGKDYNIGRTGLFLTPEASVQYSHLYMDDYTETGAGGASLRVGNDSRNALVFGVGGKLAFNANTSSGVRFVPEARARVLHDVIGDEVQTTNFFTGGGPSFSTSGADVAQTSLNLGVGVKVLNLANNVSLSADYDAELKEDFVGHNVQARLRVEF